MSGEIQVTYGVKELLALHNDKLDRIEAKVDAGNLRTAEALAKIEHRVTVLESREDLTNRVRTLEDNQSAERGSSVYRRWFLPTLATFVSAGAMALSLFHL